MDMAWWQSPEISQLVTAIVAAQMQLKPAQKKKENTFLHSKYADLSDCWDAAKVFTENGIAIVQCPMPSEQPNTMTLDTVLAHLSGEWMRSRLVLPLGNRLDPQGAGSAITYARRYALGCMTGLVTEEDTDANEFRNTSGVDEADTLAHDIKTSLDASNARESLNKPRVPFIVPFGDQKGQRLEDLRTSEIQSLCKYYLKRLQDPKNAASRYRGEWEEAVLAIEEELSNRASAEAFALEKP